MTTYRVMPDKFSEFAVEVTYPSGGSQTITEFPTREAAAEWIKTRLIADADERERRASRLASRALSRAQIEALALIYLLLL
jgi:hypothetical protein